MKLHEKKIEILYHFSGDFELIGSMLIGLLENQTYIRLKNMDELESFINAIAFDYDSTDVTITGNVYKIYTPQFKVVKRSAYAKSTDNMQEIGECYGQNCYIPTSGNCFIKSNNTFTKKDYSLEY